MSGKNVCGRIISCFISIILIGSLSSCGNSANKEANSNEINIQNGINLLSNESLDESQSYFGRASHNVAKGEKGYYFLSDNWDYILYFDQESRTSIPLCGKADCKHNNSSCNAYLGDGNYLSERIYYYKGFVYIILNRDGNAILVRENADGTERQEIGTICPYSENDSNSINLVFHGDSVYIFNIGHGAMDKEYTEVIRCFSLKDKKIENIFEYTGVNTTISNGKSYGDNLLFRIRTFTVDKDGIQNSQNLGVYSYNYTSQKTEKIIDGNVYDYSVDTKNNIIYYYVVGEGLYKYNITSNEKSKIYEADAETGFCDLSYDEKNIYMDNESWYANQKYFVADKKKIRRKCLVLDPDGKIINDIDCANATVFFGDENFLFAKKVNNIGGNMMVYINKKNIDSANDWTSLGSPIK